MRPCRVPILLFSASLVVAGCGPHLRPISDATQRVEIPGVSVLPPQGGNWFLLPVSPREGIPTDALIRFGKKLWDAPPTRSEDERLVYVGLFSMDLEERRFTTRAEFLEHFKGGWPHTGEMITGRQRLVGLEATLDDSLGATCVRYSRLTELTGTPRFPHALFTLATRGLFCLHAHWPQYAINVFYSQLHHQSQRPLALEAEGEVPLKSLVFTSTRPVAISKWP